MILEDKEGGVDAEGENNKEEASLGGSRSSWCILSCHYVVAVWWHLQGLVT